MAAKREKELTEGDFEAHPVWQYTDVEAGLVAPRLKQGAAPLLSLVSTLFTAADGRIFKGFGVTTKAALLGLTLFSGGRQVPLHFGRAVPTRHALDSAYRRLGTTPEQLFPLHYRAIPTLTHRPVWDTVDSFTFQDPDLSVQSVR